MAQANSEAENFMKPLIKTIRAAKTEKIDWKKELYTFLLNYRATPHSTTGYPPSLFKKVHFRFSEEEEEESDEDEDKFIDQNDRNAISHQAMRTIVKTRTLQEDIL